jgi:zinc protease
MQRLRLTKTCTSLVLAIGLSSCAHFNAKLTPKTHFKPITHAPYTGILKDIAHQGYKLENGLTLFLVPDNSVELTYVSVNYNVGSDVERQGQYGLAHLFEHMMFEGSKHVGAKQHTKMVENSGGTMNGTTSRDQTHYFQKVPANHLEQMLWLEADRMGFLLPALDQERFDNQIEVVLNERLERNNQPYGKIFPTLFQTLYPEDHPYHHPVIGYPSNLIAANLNQVHHFFNQWYGPQNATLTISGKFDVEQTLAWVQKYFGSIARTETPERPQAKPISLQRDKYITLEDQIHVPLAFLARPLYQPNSDNLRDRYAIDILTRLISQGRRSIFYRNLLATQDALSATLSQDCLLQQCQLIMTLASNPQVNPNLKPITHKLRQSLNNFEQFNITQEDFAAIKASLIRVQIAMQQGITQSAEVIMQAYQSPIGPQAFDQQLKVYESIRMEDLRRVHEKYIKNQSWLVISNVPHGQTAWQVQKPNIKLNQPKPVAVEANPKPLPEHNRLRKDDFDRSLVPQATTAQAPQPIQHWEKQWHEGQTILGIQDNKAPITRIELLFKHPTPLTSNSILGTVTAKMLLRATQNKNAERYEQAFDLLSTHLNVYGNAQGTTIFLNSLTSKLKQSLDLIEEGLTQAALTQTELEQIKQQMLSKYHEQAVDENYQAQLRFDQLLYGVNHPLARPEISSVEQISRITLAQVQDYFKSMIQNSSLRVMVSSDLPQAQVEQQLAFLKKWHQPKPFKERPQLPAFAMADAKPIYFFNTPKSEQARLFVGQIDQGITNEKEGFILSLVNDPLGGRFNSLLNFKLREDLGATYGMYSSFYGSPEFRKFSTDAKVTQVLTYPALQSTLEVIQSYLKQPISVETLQHMKRAWFERSALELESPQQKMAKVVRDYENQAYQGRHPEFTLFSEQERQAFLEKLTPAALHQAAKQHIKPEHFIKLVTGNESVLKALQKKNPHVVVLQ